MLRLIPQTSQIPQLTSPLLIVYLTRTPLKLSLATPPRNSPQTPLLAGARSVSPTAVLASGLILDAAGTLSRLSPLPLTSSSRLFLSHLTFTSHSLRASSQLQNPRFPSLALVAAERVRSAPRRERASPHRYALPLSASPPSPPTTIVSIHMIILSPSPLQPTPAPPYLTLTAPPHSAPPHRRGNGFSTTRSLSHATPT